jgi:hypothetical protein
MKSFFIVDLANGPGRCESFTSCKEIAVRLNISAPTVNIYIRRMYEKLQVRSRAQAVAKYAHLSDSDRRPPAATRARQPG